MSLPRVLAIMGSGETAPAMLKVHRDLFARLDAGRSDGARAGGVLLDTPYRFQENAARLSERLVEQFQSSLGRQLEVLELDREGARDEAAAARATAAIRRAPYVFAGPGSPSYALEAWRDSPIPAAIADRLTRGGVVTMASAAALTLGLLTVPVYEIYKVGEALHWLDGLDVLGASTGLRAAIVPHFDNAEGGDHDTRYCYLGEARLRGLEALMPEDAFVLGVDGHTALVLDLDARLATVAGLGGVTVRVRGRSHELQAGAQVSIDELVGIAAVLHADHQEAGDRPAATEPWPDAGSPAVQVAPPAPREGEVERLEAAGDEALDRRDPHAAVAAILALDTVLERRLRAGEDSPDLDGARMSFRALVVRLAEELAATRDATPAIDPFVATLLELRARARADRDWREADFIRERLAEAGVEVRDDPSGSTWSPTEEP